MIDVLSIVLRALGFMAIFQATGMALFTALFGTRLNSALALQLRREDIALTSVAIVLVIAHFALEPARMGGSLAAIADASLWQVALDSPLAVAFAWRIAGLVILLAGIAAGKSTGRGIAVAGAMLVFIAFARVGHTTTFTPRPVLAPLLVLHLAVVAFWFGALLPLRRLAIRAEQRIAAQVIEDFSKIAIWLVPAMLAAGLGMAVLLLGSWSNLASAYGRLLLLKVTLFAILMGLAALNRWRFGPALAAGREHAERAFSRTALIEYALISAVLFATAALTTLYSP